jgi:hypothetical protein
VFLEPVARPLLVAHALVAGTLVATTTHHLIWIVRSRGARRSGEPRFALLASLFFCAAFLLGCALYPTYRIRVRAEVFDALIPLAGSPRTARLFDIKEHVAALGLLASVTLLWLSRRVDPSGAHRGVYLALASFCCAATWVAMLAGLYVVSVRAVGAVHG